MDDETPRDDADLRYIGRHLGARRHHRTPWRAAAGGSGGLSTVDRPMPLTAELRATRRIADEIALRHDRLDLSTLGVAEFLDLRRSLFAPNSGLDEVGEVLTALLISINAVTRKPYTPRDIAIFLLEHGPGRCLHVLVRRDGRLPMVAWAWVDRHRTWSQHRKARLIRALARLLVQILATPPKPVHLFYSR